MPSAWTTTLPAGTTRIRMAPNILQDRWINIEQGEVPADKWQLQRQAGDPVSVATSGLIYTKDGGSGTSELYYEDDAGTPNVIQLTTAGGIGKSSQAVYGSTYVSLQSDMSTTFTNTQDGFVSAAGRVSSNGTQQAGYKIASTSRISTGTYQVTFDTPLTTAEGYVVVVTPRSTTSSSERNRIITTLLIAQTASYFRVRFKEIDEDYSSDVEDADIGFTFVVFMSRI